MDQFDYDLQQLYEAEMDMIMAEMGPEEEKEEPDAQEEEFEVPF